jgi:phospholipid/cholesterol/gamma-HCH transport system permease protein
LSTRANFLAQFGLIAVILWQCLAHLARVLLGRERLDLPALAAQTREVGLSVLPLMTFVSIALGLILGIQTAVILEQVNAPDLLLGAIGVAVLEEFAPLLVGFFVAARGGVALAVRIGSMRQSREFDGLLVSGVPPVPFLVVPALLAMLWMSFAFAVWTNCVVLGAMGAWLSLLEHIPLTLFRDSLADSLEVGDLLGSALKPLLFAVLVALIAASNGVWVAQEPEGVSRAATRTMVGAIAAILVADLLFLLPVGE